MGIILYHSWNEILQKSFSVDPQIAYLIEIGATVSEVKLRKGTTSLLGVQFIHFTENKNHNIYKFNNGMVLRGNARIIRAMERFTSSNFTQRRILGCIVLIIILANFCLQTEIFKGAWVS